MFPLQLLALLFISTPRLEKREEGEDGGDGQSGEKKGEVTLKRGDLLEVPRTLFTHFGIYLGGGRVAHFIPDILPIFSSDQTQIKQMVTNTRLILGVLAKVGSIRVDSLEDFAYGAKVLINTKDQVCSRPPLQGEEVAMRAEKLQGHVDYSLLWYNCEHYVMYCRYGTVISFQSFQFCKSARRLLLSRRVAKAMAMLEVCIFLYLGCVNVVSALLAFTVPFLVWMAA
ncbi:lecithin retinol acyltransferase b, tandem duplicate 2 [Cheilinus undulatus]|uniref:lecithin retinol acyltransferase b, tandem duplicate 2 n=1 Tax=Cheilinus undulatus TaxID=241271 RepID=UPI001BD4C21E|nr:lecithin retinol acyltransferase b, tandem duplicate 2 [Cheilinus undulatus]